jgi:hypothetical protein
MSREQFGRLKKFKLVFLGEQSGKLIKNDLKFMIVSLIICYLSG